MKRVLLLAFITLLTKITFSQTILYVDSAATGANNGSSWANAYRYLSSALTAANADGNINTIFVAKGTYYSTGSKTASNRDSAFVILRSQLSIYGGFDPANGVTSIGQRSIPKNGGTNTILSGNINNQTDSLDNSWHVMVIAGYENDNGTIVLDGLTITEGNGTMAPGGYKYYGTKAGNPYSYYGGGAGMLVTAPNILLKITNSKVVKNVTQGIHCRPDLVITNSSVLDNIHPAGTPGSGSHMGADGGGLYCLETLKMEDCLIAGNLIYYGFISRGAGVFASSGLDANNCVIRNNTIIDAAGCSPLFRSGGGGGIYIASGSGKIRNSFITGNKVTITEGCTWDNEFRSYRFGGGGGIGLKAHCEIVNTVISNNTAEGTNNPSDALIQFGGGGICLFDNSSLKLLNSVVYGNTALNGAAISSLDKTTSASVNISNSIILNNSSLFASSLSPVYTFSLVQGNTSTANGNLNGVSVPQVFVNAATNDFRLAPSSVCIDKGDNNYYSSSANGNLDLYAQNRIANGRIDMGAAEAGSSTVEVPRIIYVDSSVAVSGDGYSWAGAYKYLSDALNYANENSLVDSILVAKGTYYPGGVRSNADRSASFLVKYGGLKIYGGFPAGGGSFAQRILPAAAGGNTAGSTILSGDIVTPGNNGDNSYHVMVVANIPAYADSIVVDGISINDGNASQNGTLNNYNGQNVYAYAGAGAVAWNVTNEGKLHFRNCNFNNNNAHSWGGAFFNQDSKASFQQVGFFSNAVQQLNGGALFNTGTGSVLRIKNGRFEKNRSFAGSGGAVVVHNNASCFFENVFFNENMAARKGGGIFNDAGTTSEVLNGLFFQNTSNTAGLNEGGAAVAVNNASFTGTNCTFVANSTSEGLQGFLTGTGGGTMSLRNSIATHNPESGGVAAGSGTVYSQAYSLIQDQNYSTDQNLNYSTTSLTGLYNNINDADGPDNIGLTADDGLRPGANSPVREEGNNAWVDASGKDITGSIRVKGCSVDMGAYESESSKMLLYVDAQLGNDNNSGTAWNNAFRTLAKAMTIAGSSQCVDSILVAKGVYYPTGVQKTTDPVYADRATSFLITRGGIKLYGGFQPGGAGGWAAREFLSNQLNTGSVLSGDIGANADSTFNSYHVMLIAGIPANADSIVVDGFGIGYGCANLLANTNVNGYLINFSEGAGLHLRAVHKSTVIRNCAFYRNYSRGRGGALVTWDADATIFNCRLFNNKTSHGGAGVHNVGGAARFVNCNFFNNQTVVGYDNEGDPYGGSGGAIMTSTTNAKFVNCNIVNNTAELGGSAIYGYFNATPVFSNCILWGNSTNGTGLIALIGTAAVSFNNSIIQGGYAGTANLDADPLFVNMASGNPQLQNCSPALNAGDNTMLLPGESLDINGAKRIQLGKVDIGVYESTVSESSASIPATNTAVMNVQSSSGPTAYSDNCNRLLAVLSGDNSVTAVNGVVTAKLWIDGAQPETYVKRHYEITPEDNAVLATGRVTLFFTQAEFDAFNAVNVNKLPVNATDAVGKARLLIEKRPGVSSNGTGLPSTYSGAPVTIDPDDASIVWNATASRWEVSFSVTGFSGFFVKTQSGALPLNLLNFSGKRLNGVSLLSWETADEERVSHFEIERSRNGENFYMTGKVPAKNGNSQRYEYNDTIGIDGAMFYRLKMVDIDGKTTYSQILRLADKASAGIAVRPNPAKGKIWIEAGPAQLIGSELLFIDGFGRTVKQTRISRSLQEIDISSLPAGVYYLRFANGQLSKMIKE